MQAKRGQMRVAVDVPVTITTVLDSIEGTVINLSQAGALIEGAVLPKGTDFQLDCEGHTIFAKVMWVEPDRMGVRFPFEMQEGPLFQLLEHARFARTHRRGMPPVTLSAIAQSGFGRRGR